MDPEQAFLSVHILTLGIVRLIISLQYNEMKMYFIFTVICISVITCKAKYLSLVIGHLGFLFGEFPIFTLCPFSLCGSFLSY